MTSELETRRPTHLEEYLAMAVATYGQHKDRCKNRQVAGAGNVCSCGYSSARDAAMAVMTTVLESRGADSEGDE